MPEEDVDPLITECPNCQTRFRVTENQLRIAAGRVRCGACLTVFQGVEHLLWDNQPLFENDSEAQSALDELLNELGSPVPGGHQQVVQDDVQAGVQADSDSEQEPPDPAAWGDEAIAIVREPEEAWSQPAHQLYGGHEEPSQLAPDELPRIEQKLAGEGRASAERENETETEPDFEFESDPDVEIEEWSIDADERQQPAEIVIRAANDPAPHNPVATGTHARAPAAAPEQFAATRHFTFGRDPSKRRWWVLIATAGAIAALIAQVLWYQFAVWARDPDLRPMYGLICELLGCDLPIMRDIDSMLAQNLVVRSHPDVANALLVDAIIINQAAFVQPFPVLELRFTALGGDLVAGRRFQPEEYLAGDLAGATVMQSQIPIHVELAIEDPGVDAVNYFLSFR